MHLLKPPTSTYWHFSHSPASTPVVMAVAYRMLLVVPYKFDCYAILYPEISGIHYTTLFVTNWGRTYWIFNPPLYGTICEIETGSKNSPTEIPSNAGSNW